MMTTAGAGDLPAGEQHGWWRVEGVVAGGHMALWLGYLWRSAARLNASGTRMARQPGWPIVKA